MDSTEELYRAFTNVSTENVDNVISDKSNKELQFDQTVSVRIPKIREQVSVDKINVQKIKKFVRMQIKKNFLMLKYFWEFQRCFWVHF